MADAGVFQEDDRIELIQGEMIEMAPIGPAHAYRVNEVAAYFYRSVAGRAVVSVQNPVLLPPDSELQPDVALLRPASHRYRQELPAAGDVLLLVEVADSTLAYDRDVKIPIYAANGIVEAWVLDNRAETILVFREPREGVYTEQFELDVQASITPRLMPGLVVQVADLYR